MKKLVLLLRSELFFYLFFYVVLLLLKANEIGMAMRDRIPLLSTLDFSWQSDSIERLLHGYIQGRDFIFTYGPLYQFLYSLPSLILHLPSYISVLLGPFISITLSLLMSIIIVKSLTHERLTQLTLITFLWFVLGLISFDPLNMVRILIPLFYISIWIHYIPTSKTLSTPILLVSLLPTLFGFFSYDLFLSTFLLTLIFSFFYSFSQKKSKYIFHIVLIILFQILGSLALTHNLSYISYSLDTVRNYYYVMNIGWAKDRSNVLFIFPIILTALCYKFWKSKNLSKKEKVILFAFAFVSLFEIRTAFARSDAGHIIKALYPSIITTFIFLFFIAKNHRKLLILGFFLYLLIPFKPTYYNTLSPKNIINVISVVKNPPSFFNIYKLPIPFYYTEQDLSTINTLIKHNPGQVYIYPYDNYILNVFQTTYNSFSLQPYQYSASLVEQETIRRLKMHPPRFIILGLDTRGALNLDDIPNFTRNPLIAQWMLQNYEIKTMSKPFVVLSFNPKKEIRSITNSCSSYKLTLSPLQTPLISHIVASIFKANIYYLSEKPLIRLPVTNNSTTYTIFDQDNKGILNLFDQALTFNEGKVKNQSSLTIYQENQLTKRKTPITLKKGEFNIQCLN